jgi:hypothetical protein
MEECFMKKTFLLWLTVMLTFGMTLVSCGGEDEEGPPIYTVTFKDATGSTTLATVGKVLPGKTIQEVLSWENEYQSVEKVDTKLEELFSTDVNTVKEGWFDQDDNRVLADIPITKDLTVTPKFFVIPETDVIAIASDAASIAAFDITLSHINEGPPDRTGGYKYFRLTGDPVADHVYQISFSFDIKKKDTQDAVKFKGLGIQSSMDRYSSGVDWYKLGAADSVYSSGTYETKIANKVAAGKEALTEKAFKFIIDNAVSSAIGDVVTVTITDLTITDLGEQLNAVFKANGGTGDDVTVAVNKGDAVALASIPTFTNAGKYLKGWSTAASGDPQVDPYYEPINADTTYHAIWVNGTEEEGYWVKNLGTDLAQNIDLADYPADTYIEFVFPKYPLNDGIGAIAEVWNGWETINSPSSDIGEFRPRYLIKTLKAKASALSKPTLVNLVGNWKGEGGSSTEINLITFNGPAPTILTLGANGQYGYQVTIPSPEGVANGKTYTITYTFTLDKPVNTLQFAASNASWATTSDGYYRLHDYTRVSPAPTVTDDVAVYAADTEYTGSFDMAIIGDGTDKIAITSALLATDTGVDEDGNKIASASNAAKAVFSVLSIVEKVAE